MKPEIHAWQIELDGPVTNYTESIDRKSVV